MSSQQSDSGRDTAGAIISAAERLFAAQGIDGVSLREIMREAGQRNTTSLQYHFGDRDGLLRALVEKHTATIAPRRSALLELLESRTDVSLRDASAALVRPILSKMTDPDGGPEFLRIAAELVNRVGLIVDPAEPVGALIYDGDESLTRWREIVRQLIPAALDDPRIRRRFAVIRFAHMEVGRRAASAPGADHALFASQLIDLCTAMLEADLSPDTNRLLHARPRTMPPDRL